MLLPLLALGLGALAAAANAESACQPVFVRWPRVKLNQPPALQGQFSQKLCRTACAQDEDPNKAGVRQACSAFNHRVGPTDYHNECQIFDDAAVKKVDGVIEADDRYSFFWKYCLKTNRSCSGDYGFTFLSDRYISADSVTKTKKVDSLQDCLADCLNQGEFKCRSLAFNRTSQECHISPHNQLSKPAMVKINNNPNYRVDYYENNCFNTSDSFTFNYSCEDGGVRVKVQSKFPYTGALYGLYDFFTCRVEPQEQKDFELLFPYPSTSKNCSDSIRYKGDEIVLEVVLSTDGVEPLYFITADDLTFQARCPVDAKDRERRRNSAPSNANDNVQSLLSALADAQNHGSFMAKSKKVRMNGIKQKAGLEAFDVEEGRSTTKDVFPLPLLTTGTPKPASHALEAITELVETSTTSTTTTSTTTSTSVAPTTAVQPSSSQDQKPAKSSSTKTVVPPTVNPESPKEQFRFSTRITFPSSNKISVSTGPAKSESLPTTSTSSTTTSPATTSTTTASTTTTTTSTTSTTTTTTPSTTTAPIVKDAETSETSTTTTTTPLTQKASDPTPPPKTSTTTAPLTTTSLNSTGGSPPGSPRKEDEAVVFDIYHNGHPADAVVVSSRITLSFTPFYAIPPAYMAISGCQVEPIESLYDWEKEPLPIVKDGCQADHIGLVCPPVHTDYGVRVTMESFRYQTTAQVQYTCLVRICPFAPCPQTTCSAIEGCPQDDLVSRTLGLRHRRALSFEQIRAALAANPMLQQQLGLGSPQTPQLSTGLHQKLLTIGGDHIVRKKLVVLNSDEELEYYVKTGELPEHHGRK